jgi:hypothetical protein
MEFTQANICISDRLMPAKNIIYTEHNNDTNKNHNIKISKPALQKLNKPTKCEPKIFLDSETTNSIRPANNINYSNSKITQLNNELKAGIYYHISKDLRKLY